jgi:hypothetical protein
MNANSTHLDLEDLIAEVNGQAIGDEAREHLAGCAQCQLEAKRWDLVAGGVRGLADEASGLPEPARSPRTGRRVLAGPWRPALMVVGSAAAAVVLVLAIGTAAGLVHVHLGSGSSATPPGASGTTLTAVSGCAQLAQASGTLERVTGAGAVIRTASGQLVTVTTTPATRLSASGLSASGALRGAIADGAAVSVAGTSSHGTIAADLVLVGTSTQLTVPGYATVRGTVADAGAAGFTVATSAGARVPVTTPGTTAVTVFKASLSQLQDGGVTTALGHAGPHGTLSALALVQPPGWPAGARTSVSVRDCSATSVNREIQALAAGG